MGEERLELAAQQQEQQKEVRAAGHHEHDGDGLDDRAVPIGDALAVGGEPAGGHGAHGDVDGVEGGHAGRPVGHGAGDDEPVVDEQDHAGGLGGARQQVVGVALGVVHAQAAGLGYHAGEDEHEPHTAEVAGEAAVEQEDGRAGVHVHHA